MSFARHKDENGNVVPLIEREEFTATVDGKSKIQKYIRLLPAGKEFAAELNIQ